MAFAAYLDAVQKIYIAFYQRPADPAGLRYWAQRMDAAGGNQAAVIDAFASSPEAVALYGVINGTTIGAVIDKIYMALFNRAPDEAGKKFYVDGFNAGKFTAGSITLSVLGGAQNDDAVAVSNKLSVANEFTKQVDGREMTNVDFGTGSIFNATYAGDADAVAARAILKAVTSSPSTVLNASQVTEQLQTKIADAGDAILTITGADTFTLTVNQDVKTAHIFEAPIFTSTTTGNQIQTLTSVDKLTGTSATDDVLNATLNGTETTTKPTMTGVENANITSIAASVFDAANVTGVTSIGSVDSSANLTIRNLAAGANGQVKSSAVGVHTLVQYANAAVAGTSDAVTLNLSNIGRGTTAANATVINLRGETAGGFETINVVSSGGASRLNDLTSDAGAGLGVGPAAATAALRTLNVSGDSNLRIDNQLTNVTTVDANAFKGNLRVTLDATKTMTVTGGTGNDTFIFAAGLNTSDTVNGGDGRDTISVTTNTALADGNKLSNVEILQNAGAAGGTSFNMGKVASLDAIVHATANAATYTDFSKAGAADATKGINQSGTGAVTVSVKDAGGLGSNADTLQVTVGAPTNAATYVAGAVTTSAIETIKVAVADAGGNTATAGGAFLTADTAVGSVVFTGGSVGVAFNSGAVGGSGVALTNIDGSAFIGNLTVTGNAFSQVIKGGSGDDVLGSGGRAAFADALASDVLTGGAGADTFGFVDGDTVITGANLTTAAASTADGLSEITSIADLNLGGASAATAVDKIDLSALTVLGADADNAITIVNAGAVQALSGANLGDAVNALVNAGTLLDGNATTAIGGLFSFGSDVYFIATSGATVNDNFGAVANSDIIIRVTGVTGTLDASDIIV